MHTYVARLRRVLEPDRAPRESGQVLAGHGAGYRLDIDPDQLDVHVFERRLDRARALLAAGDVAGSAHELVEALVQWQGVPFTGVPGPFAEVERTRLEELRLVALEDLAAARLRLGQHTEVAADLAALARQHPFRERLRALEMLALGGSGRQVEALRVYADVRRQLVDELGVEPGRALQQAHRQVLVGESGGPSITTGTPPPLDEIPMVRRVGRRRPALMAGLVIAGGASVLVGSAAPANQPAAPLPAVHAPAAVRPTAALVAGDDDRFVADVTIPDGARVTAGQEFTKIWEIQNTGTVEWRNRYLQRQDLDDAAGRCTSPARVPVTTTEPGEHVRIAVTLRAPALPGSCEVHWQLVDAQGRLSFPGKAGLYLVVYVS